MTPSLTVDIDRLIQRVVHEMQECGNGRSDGRSVVVSGMR